MNNRFKCFRAGAAALLAGLLLLTGCSADPFSVARRLNLQMPQVSLAGYNLLSAKDDRVEVESTLFVHNPNALSIDLSRLQAEAYIEGVKVADIRQMGTATLPAQDSLPLNLMITAYTDRLWPCLAAHIQQGESSRLVLRGTANIGYGWLNFPYPFTYERSIKTNLMSRLTLKKEIALPVDGLNITAVRSAWGAITDDSLQILHDVSVTNQNRDAVTLRTGGYDVTGNGIALAEGAVDDGVAVVAPGKSTVRLTNTVSTHNIARWLATHLNRGETTTLELKFKPGSVIEQARGDTSLDGRTFNAEIQTNLVKRTLSFK